MKFTLKNRPKLKDSYLTYHAESLKWFEGFEKQETKRLSDAEFAQMDLQKTGFQTEKRRAYYEGYAKAKQEILGEEL